MDGPSIKRLAALTLAALSWMLYTEQDPVKVVSIKSVKWSPVCTPWVLFTLDLFRHLFQLSVFSSIQNLPPWSCFIPLIKPTGESFPLCPRSGKIQKGERVLIHAGASGVGMAAIQLVKLANAIPIVTAGTQEKLKATANAGAAAGFDYKNEDFSEKVLAFTQGKNLWVEVTVEEEYVPPKAYAHHSVSTGTSSSFQRDQFCRQVWFTANFSRSLWCWTGWESSSIESALLWMGP